MFFFCVGIFEGEMSVAAKKDYRSKPNPARFFLVFKTHIYF